MHQRGRRRHRDVSGETRKPIRGTEFSFLFKNKEGVYLQIEIKIIT